MEALIGILLLFGVVALLIAYNAFAWGTVVFYFYTWFILPIFINLPYISLKEAIGLGLFISLFKPHTYKKVDKEAETDWGIIGVNMLMPWIVLLLAYFIKQTLL